MRGCLEGMIQFVDDFSQENDKRQREDFASKNLNGKEVSDEADAVAA